MLEIWAEARRNRHENENQPRREGVRLQEAPGGARRAGGHTGRAGGSSVGRDDEWGIVPVTKKARDILDYVGLEVPKIAKTGVPLCSIEDKIEAVEDGA